MKGNIWLYKKNQMHNKKNVGFCRTLRSYKIFSPLNNRVCIWDLLNFTNPTGFYEFMSLDARRNAKHPLWVFPFIKISNSISFHFCRCISWKELMFTLVTTFHSPLMPCCGLSGKCLEKSPFCWTVCSIGAFCLYVYGFCNVGYHISNLSLFRDKKTKYTGQHIPPLPRAFSTE